MDGDLRMHGGFFRIRPISNAVSTCIRPLESMSFSRHAISLAVAMVAASCCSAFAWEYDAKHRGNDNNYDHLYEKWKIIAKVCVHADDASCREMEIKVEVISATECELVKTRFVTQWIIDNSLDHFRKIGKCVPSYDHGI
jgi:hypothetical protein